jgi:hypothetical protein
MTIPNISALCFVDQVRAILGPDYEAISKTPFAIVPELEALIALHLEFGSDPEAHDPVRRVIVNVLASYAPGKRKPHPVSRPSAIQELAYERRRRKDRERFAADNARLRAGKA